MKGQVSAEIMAALIIFTSELRDSLELDLTLKEGKSQPFQSLPCRYSSSLSSTNVTRCITGFAEQTVALFPIGEGHCNRIV